MKPMLDESLPQKVSILAIDDGCLCGLFLNNVHKAEHREWREPVMKEDYGEGKFKLIFEDNFLDLEFDAHTTPSENFKKVAVMLDVVESFVAQNLPADVNEYIRLDVLSVHKAYTK